MRSCQGRRRRAAFILTLDSPASHCTIELGTKRNAVQLSFVPSWSGFRSFSSLLVGIHTPPHRSGILHHHRLVAVTEHSGFASNQVLSFGTPLGAGSRRALLYILDVVDLKDLFLPDKARRARIDHGKTDGIGNREDDRRRSRLARTGREYHLAQSCAYAVEHRPWAGANWSRSIPKREGEEAQASGLMSRL